MFLIMQIFCLLIIIKTTFFFFFSLSDVLQSLVQGLSPPSQPRLASLAWWSWAQFGGSQQLRWGEPRGCSLGLHMFGFSRLISVCQWLDKHRSQTPGRHLDKLFMYFNSTEALLLKLFFSLYQRWTFRLMLKTLNISHSPQTARSTPIGAF